MTPLEDAKGRTIEIDSEEAENEENLSDLLDNLDIDREFNAFASFRQSMKDLAKTIPSWEKEELPSWLHRLARPEVYSHQYQPSRQELHEVDQLRVQLGLEKPSSGLFGATNSHLDTGTQKAWTHLWNSPSILLFRGPVQCQESEMEVVVLTHGLLLVQIELVDQTVQRQLVKAWLWPQLVTIQTPDDDSFLLCGKERSFHCQCSSPRALQAWREALEHIWVENARRSPKVNRSTLGWQYGFVERPGFSYGTGHIATKPDRIDNVILQHCDEYNGLTPLHYAVRLQLTDVVQHLLKLGANPNAPDAEDSQTPVFYAIRDHHEPITQLLLKHGGIRPRAVDDGELFGRVQASDRLVQSERSAQAQAAQAQMNENMRLLQERGEKIREMDDRARQLNDGASDYADLASQLKAKVTQKKWYHIF